MITEHQIGELDRTGIILRPTPAEAQTLARITDRIGVESRPDGSVRIFSRGQVGSIALSSNTVVRVTTKVPAGNVLGLASLAYGSLTIPPSVGHALLGSGQPSLDWLALLLVTELEALLARGLRHDYVSMADELRHIRGRLRFDMSAIAKRPGLTPCEFDDFQSDISENRILKATLHLLTTQQLLLPLRPRIEDLLRRLSPVALVRPSQRLLTSCLPNRLNQHYGPALDLCRLVLERSGVELVSGLVSVPAYFFPMELVFQEAVTTFLRRRLPHVHRQSSRLHTPTAGTPSRSLRFVPDIVLGVPPQLVIDTKYASAEALNQWGTWSYRNDDVYQALSYALSCECPALLVYPRAERDINVTFDIGGVSVTILSIDLTRPVSFPKSFPPGDSQNHSPTLRAGGRSLLTAS